MSPRRSSPDLQRHQIEFTGRPVVKKKGKPLPRWIVGCFGGVLWVVLGAALGATGLLALGQFVLSRSEDAGSFLGMALVLLFAAAFGTVVGAITGCVIWAVVRAKAHSQSL